MNGQQPEQVVVTSLVNILTETQKRILAILAASDGATISLDHLLSLTSDPEAQKAARGLVELGLVQAHSPRYSLKGDLVVSLAVAWDLSSWENTLINYFVNWVTQQPSQILMEESAEALIRVVKKAEEKKRWSEVISIGRGLEKTYALWKRWQSWSDILNIILKAAKALGDKKVEGWVLHQLGTRAMCLGLADQGRALLSQALNIRRVIGDKAGLALTQHNLNLLMGIPIPIKGGQSGCRRYLGCGCGAVGGIGVLVVLAVAVLLLFPGSPPATPVPYYVDTDTPFPTVTDTSTPKPFLTLTPSSTPRPTITPTSTPSVLYDFVENANKAQWYMYYADYSGNAIVGYDQATGVKFFEELPSYNPDQYVTQLGQSYAGWERKPVFTDGSFAPLVVLAYPYCSSEGCYNLKLGGFYDLSYLTLGENDYLTLKTGYRLPPPATLDEGEAFIYDGVTFRISFYENDPQTAILLGSLTQTNDGTIKDWTVPIPPELAGKSGWFLLEVDPGPYSYLDWSTWAEAQLIRP